MKNLFLAIAIIAAGAFNASAQEYIKSNSTVDGVHTIESFPAIFQHQTEGYLLTWNYINSLDANIEGYYLAVMCSEQAAPWNVSAGDKLYLGLVLENEYIELTALTDAAPTSYETITGTKYRTLAYYIVPPTEYDELYKGFDRFKIDVKVNNTTPVTLAVKLPFTAVEHMLMSYLDIMIASGR